MNDDERVRLHQLAGVPEAPIKVDFALAVCNGCGAERRAELNPPLQGSDEVATWLKTKAFGPCVCGYPTCEIKLRMVARS